MPATCHRVILINLSRAGPFTREMGFMVGVTRCVYHYGRIGSFVYGSQKRLKSRMLNFICLQLMELIFVKVGLRLAT